MCASPRRREAARTWGAPTGQIRLDTPCRRLHVQYRVAKKGAWRSFFVWGTRSQRPGPYPSPHQTQLPTGTPMLNRLLTGVFGSRNERLLKQLQRIVTKINARSEEHTSELQSLMRISYAVFR